MRLCMFVLTGWFSLLLADAVTGEDAVTVEDRQRCTKDSQCLDRQRCTGDVCIDVCSGDNICGQNAFCQAVNHRVTCSCLKGYLYGDPLVACKQYKRIQKQDSRMTWWEAKKYCNDRDGDLVTILTPEEGQQFQLEAAKIRGAVWMGAYCITSDSDSCYWKISERKIPMDSYYTNWHSGEPDTYYYGSDDAHCAVSSSLFEGRPWSLTDCGNTNYFICQFYY